MDHFTITLILAGLEAIIVPWAVFITRRNFENEKNIAVLRSQKDEMARKMDELKTDMQDLKKHIDSRLDKIMDRLSKI